MRALHVNHSGAIGFAFILFGAVSDQAFAQRPMGPAPGTDSVTVVAFSGYRAGGLKRAFLGDNYRDLWTTRIKVPVLDLRSFGGGLTPTKKGGGKQSVNLRFVAPDSAEWVFRPVYKPLMDLPEEFKGTVVYQVTMDARSASHPLAPLAAPVPLAAVGILHPNPRVYMMPDDSALGEFRKEFAGLLGTMEEYPSVPKSGVAFAGAIDIIDPDQLLERINKDPNERVDTRAFLTAHLVDMLLGDNDRHAGQWKWARLTPGGLWQPIPRDRDKVFVSYEGFLLNIARMMAPELVTFRSAYPRQISSLFDNAIEFDRRLLGGVEKPVWDSIANAVVTAISDSAIDASLARMPRDYAGSLPSFREKLRARRAQLPRAAAEYYSFLSTVVDLHATDTADRATVERATDGFVDVRIQAGDAAPWFQRRFDARETREIRLYLHGGDDNATVTGSVGSSIPVRIIGGNGNNTIVDQSVVGGRRNPTYIYETGSVTSATYEPDSITKKKAESDEGELPYDRRPYARAYGRDIPPGKDRGTTMGPLFGIKSGHGLGLVPKIGIGRKSYAFRHVPYASMTEATIGYSTKIRGFEIELEHDKRFESTGFHIPTVASMSQLEVIEFRGFGNDVPLLEGTFYEVRQRQWLFHPAAAFAFGPNSDIGFGPVVRYSDTDSTANRFISQERPYGFGKFGQAGVQLRLLHDTRFMLDTARSRGGFKFSSYRNPPLWGTVEIGGSYYPEVWDAESAYGKLAGVATAFLTVPVLTNPVIALRAGGEKLFGDFPYFDAAFIGGSESFRTEHRQRYAGDASLFGSAELRVPIAKFPFILPLDVGALGFIDVARVYVDGESPGGLHRGTGGGIWIGVMKPETNLSIMVTNNPDRRVLTTLGFAF